MAKKKVVGKTAKKISLKKSNVKNSMPKKVNPLSRRRRMNLYSNLSSKHKAKKDEKSRRRAEYLATLDFIQNVYLNGGFLGVAKKLFLKFSLLLHLLLLSLLAVFSFITKKILMALDLMKLIFPTPLIHI